MGWPPSLRGDIPEHRHVLERYHAPVGLVHEAAELYYLHHLGSLLYVGESAILVVEGTLTAIPSVTSLKYWPMVPVR